MCDEGFIWNPINCECECDKSCDVGEDLNYENCKCRKKLADKLVEECTETLEKTKLAKIALNEDKIQFLHTVHRVIFNNFYSQCWHWYLFSSFSLVPKIRCLSC